MRIEMSLFLSRISSTWTEFAANALNLKDSSVCSVLLYKTGISRAHTFSRNCFRGSIASCALLKMGHLRINTGMWETPNNRSELRSCCSVGLCSLQVSFNQKKSWSFNQGCGVGGFWAESIPNSTCKSELNFFSDPRCPIKSLFTSHF